MGTPTDNPTDNKLQKIISLCKRRGFVFQSSEIYGGCAACWDYGPLGAQLKLNVKNLWWQHMCAHPNVVGLDSAILMHPKVWEASGHTENFTDPLVDCRNCKHRFRLEEPTADQHACPKCGSTNITDPRAFNLMFKTQMGPLEDEGQKLYLRPETAQGIFVNFENIQASGRHKLPFGVAQIGKAFRNEITPGNFIFRTREFEQMEMQYFTHPQQATKDFNTWLNTRMQFYTQRLGFNSQNLRLHPHNENELAHYAKQAQDIEYKFPFGWQELEGIHNRGDFDLQSHQKHSGKKLQYFDAASNQHYVPYVIETSAGCDRNTLALLCEVYTEEALTSGDARVVLKFPPKLAPVEVAVLPLSKKDPLTQEARKIHQTLSQHFRHPVRRLAKYRQALQAPRRNRHHVLRHLRLRKPPRSKSHFAAT